MIGGPARDFMPPSPARGQGAAAAAAQQYSGYAVGQAAGA
jgi:hypothetical protein